MLRGRSRSNNTRGASSSTRASIAPNFEGVRSHDLRLGTQLPLLALQRDSSALTRLQKMCSCPPINSCGRSCSLLDGPRRGGIHRGWTTRLGRCGRNRPVRSDYRPASRSCRHTHGRRGESHRTCGMFCWSLLARRIYDIRPWSTTKCDSPDARRAGNRSARSIDRCRGPDRSKIRRAGIRDCRFAVRPHGGIRAPSTTNHGFRACSRRASCCRHDQSGSRSAPANIAVRRPQGRRQRPLQPSM